MKVHSGTYWQLWACPIQVPFDIWKYEGWEQLESYSSFEEANEEIKRRRTQGSKQYFSILKVTRSEDLVYYETGNGGDWKAYE